MVRVYGDQRRTLDVLFYPSPLCTLETCYFREPGPRLVARTPRWSCFPYASDPHEAGLRDMCPCLAFYVDLGNLNSCAHACAVSESFYRRLISQAHSMPSWGKQKTGMGAALVQHNVIAVNHSHLTSRAVKYPHTHSTPTLIPRESWRNRKGSFLLLALSINLILLLHYCYTYTSHLTYCNLYHYNYTWCSLTLS